MNCLLDVKYNEEVSCVDVIIGTISECNICWKNPFDTACFEFLKSQVFFIRNGCSYCKISQIDGSLLNALFCRNYRLENKACFGYQIKIIIPQVGIIIFSKFPKQALFSFLSFQQRIEIN
jgi:hypothetical protein